MNRLPTTVFRDMELTSELDNSQLQDQLRRLMVKISFYLLGYNLHDKIWSCKKVLTLPQNKKNCILHTAYKSANFQSLVQ
jgi:hypothetical protein